MTKLAIPEGCSDTSMRSGYPITLQTANRVASAIQCVDALEPWVVVSTLNNRMLLINVSNVQRLYMLDDNADQVSDDWELGWDSYQGHSSEIYRALADWAMELLDEKEFSETFRAGLADLIEEERLTADLVIERVVETHIHFTSGQVWRCRPGKRSLLEAFNQVEMPTGQLVFDLSEPDAGLTTYVPMNAARLIDMPLYQLSDALKAEQEEHERISAKEQAEVILKKMGVGSGPKKRGRPRKT